MSSLRSIADSRRSMATFIPVIAYGEWRCASDGARKRSADSTSAMPRRTSKWATVEATLPARRRLGFARKPLARASTDTASAGLAVHFIARPSRRHPKIHALQIDILRTSQAGLVVRIANAHQLGLVILIRFVNCNPPEIFAHFEEALVSFVPLGAGFVEEHATLVRPAKLYETGLTDVGSEPAGIFQVLVIAVLAVGEAADHLFHVLLF